MRILVYNWKDLAHPAAGGAEVYVETIARHWAEWGHDVTLFCARAPGQAADERLEGVRHVRRGGRLGVYREAHRYFASEDHDVFDVVVDVVNTRPFLTPVFVSATPVVALAFQVAREVWSYEVPRAAAAVGRHWLEPRWLRRYAEVPTLTISESSRRSLEEYGLRDVSVVPVGLELAAVVPQPAKERLPTAVFVGRLAPNKRPDHAVRAFCQARRNMDAGRMWIVGTGPMEASLRRRFAGDEVTFHGRIGDAEKLDLMARAHALLVTSVREGWGLVVTEAAAVGTPSIGYDIPGLRDSLSASGGVIVRPAIDALARALADVLPRWGAGAGPTVRPGGVAPWSEVATEVLDHLERARGSRRR